MPRRSPFFSMLLHVPSRILLSTMCCLPALVQAGEELVAEDTCIVELQLPEGTTVRVDGKDYGSAPG